MSKVKTIKLLGSEYIVPKLNATDVQAAWADAELMATIVVSEQLEKAKSALEKIKIDSNEYLKAWYQKENKDNESVNDDLISKGNQFFVSEWVKLKGEKTQVPKTKYDVMFLERMENMQMIFLFTSLLRTIENEPIVFNDEYQVAPSKYRLDLFSELVKENTIDTIKEITLSTKND